MEARGERTWCGQCQATELWPENIPAVELYLAAGTQWRYVGIAGAPVGLDYVGVRTLMELRAVPASEQPALFADLQILEREHVRLECERLKRDATKPPSIIATPAPRRPRRP